MNDIVTLAGSVVSLVLIPLLTVFHLWKEKKRKVAAEVKKQEADNITHYAAEWKELYEKKESRVNELDGKIDKLHENLDTYRSMVRELREEIVELKLENQKLKYHRCDVRGCRNRRPPSEMMD